MASSQQGRPGGHLEFREGQEIVYCHVCSNEWYREGQSLECPRCHNDVTEIVEPENDPRREDDALPALESPPRFLHHTMHDSDPDEENIASPFPFGPSGFMSSSRRASPGPPRDRNRNASDPNDGDAVLRRFTEMLRDDFRAQPTHGGARDELFPSGPSGPSTRIRTTTWRGPFMGGTTTFTIATGPMTAHSPQDFSRTFGNLMGNVGPGHEDDVFGGRQGMTIVGGPATFAAGLQELIQHLINPAAAVHGDAVYSQEALDRIITSLMEANPQSNAAPPASEAALSRLEKKKVDKEMLGPEGKAECTICIDELNLGDEVTKLPCKHWFHGECVTLWLKEHNTCPICRTPIESRDDNAASSSSSQPNQPHAVSTPVSPTFGSRNRPDRPLRSARENEDRLAAIRNLAELRNNSSDRPNHSSRRNSLSPREQRTMSASELASRVRVRSPSFSRDRDPGSIGRPPENSSGGSGSGNGPLSWLRNTFSRSRDGSDGGGDQHQHRRPPG